MWSQVQPIEDKTVVSDMGEQWSPKTPPQVTAAIAGYTDASSDNAMGIAMGMKMPKVPQEVPVEKAVKDAIAWCHVGPPSGRVDNVEVSYETPSGEFNSFQITW